MPMALTGAGPGSVGVANVFPFLRGSRMYAQSTIMRKPRLWSHVAMDVD